MSQTKGASAAPGLSPEQLDTLARELLRKGVLIEAGFAGLRRAAIPPDAPPRQIELMRLAFFAGAQHVFSVLVETLDPGEDPTDADMARIAAVDNELQQFYDDFALQYLRPAKGQA